MKKVTKLTTKEKTLTTERSRSTQEGGRGREDDGSPSDRHEPSKLDNAGSTPAAPSNFRMAMEKLSRVERFMATVYAVNTALIKHGIVSAEEMQQYYCEWADAQQGKPMAERVGLA